MCVGKISPMANGKRENLGEWKMMNNLCYEY